jgi:hypothetical protein
MLPDHLGGGNMALAVALLTFAFFAHHCDFRKRRGLPCLGF